MKNIQQYQIIKNVERYDNIDPKMPIHITCIGTLEQANELAERLSNWNAGCDYSYFVLEATDHYLE